jgi:GH18 family chitinase
MKKSEQWPSQESAWFGGPGISFCTVFFVLLTGVGMSFLRADESDTKMAVVGYLPEYRVDQVSSEALKPLTDLVYFGLNLPEDGRLQDTVVAPGVLKKLNEIKKTADCRLLVSVGGWGRSAGFPTLAANEKLRREFVKDLFAYCRKNGFAGVDLDWEHPASAKELAAYQLLLINTKKIFGPAGLLVTVAQAGWQDLGEAAYQAVDRVHLMSYDHDYPHATFAKSTKDVERLLDWGCPPSKIAMGVPFYGRNRERGALSYRDLVKDKTPDPDLDELDGYAFNGRSTMLRKVAYVRKKRLAGLMIWEVGHDDGRKEISLLQTITRAIDEKPIANPQ